jgi:dissimilatory sulfite reductase related protein
MATKTIAGKTVQVNEEGYLTNAAEWTKEIAVELAKEEGIADLSAAHWKVIDYCRQWAGANGGKAPTLRTITSNAGVTTKELFGLFPRARPRRWPA